MEVSTAPRWGRILWELANGGHIAAPAIAPTAPTQSETCPFERTGAGSGRSCDIEPAVGPKERIISLDPPEIKFVVHTTITRKGMPHNEHREHLLGSC